MGRIQKALNKLRTKCTPEGTHPSGNSTADILDCIAEHFEAGGSSLPDVTSADNGKVLTVVEGEWNKGEAGGSDIFVVNIALNEETGTFTSDKTYSEMEAAYNSNKIIICKTKINSMRHHTMDLFLYNYDDTPYFYIDFGVVTGEDEGVNGVRAIRLKHSSTGEKLIQYNEKVFVGE